MDRYELEFLEETFYRHAESAKKQHDEMVIKYKNEFSSDKLPDYLKDEFSLPVALLSIVEEVKRLKRKIRCLEDAQVCFFLQSTASHVDPEPDSNQANT